MTSSLEVSLLKKDFLNTKGNAVLNSLSISFQIGSLLFGRFKLSFLFRSGVGNMFDFRLVCRFLVEALQSVGLCDILSSFTTDLILILELESTPIPTPQWD